MEGEIKTEKFNAAIDNLKNILELKRNAQNQLMSGQYSECGESLILLNDEIIGWKSKTNDTEAEDILKKYENTFESLKNPKYENSAEQLKVHVRKWKREVTKYLYEIWLSKLEDDFYSEGLAV